MENNKLIADFIGIKEIETSIDSYGTNVPIWYCSYLDYRSLTYYTPNKAFECLIKDSKFNTSWDWLMPVCQKMWAMVIDNDWGSDPNMFSDIIHAMDDIQIACSDFDLDRAFESVIDFINAVNYLNNENGN